MALVECGLDVFLQTDMQALIASGAIGDSASCAFCASASRRSTCATSMSGTPSKHRATCSPPKAGACLNRDWTQPMTHDATVEAAWLEVYRNPSQYWDL